MNVPKIRFSEFTSEYKKYKFKDVATLYRGSSPRPIINFITKSDDGVNWIKIGDVNENDTYINKTSEKITVEGSKKSRKVYKNDIILSNSMSFGRPYILNIDGCIHDGWFVVRDYNEKLVQKYLYHFMSSPVIQKQYKKLSAGGVVSNISSDLVYSVDINIPSKEEQIKVSNFLSLIDKKIELQSKKIEDLKLFKLYYYDIIFSSKLYDCFKLGDVVSCLDKKRKPISSELRKQGIYPYYGANGIQDYIDDYIFDGCYVLLAEDGGNFSDYNTKSIAQLAKGKIWVNNHAHVLVGDKIDTEFLFYQLEHMDIRQYINGTSRSKLNQEDMMNILLQIPSIEEQKKISKVFNTIEKKIYLEKNKYEKLTELKKGLMQNMFV